jgi:hypothetical protein
LEDLLIKDRPRVIAWITYLTVSLIILPVCLEVSLRVTASPGEAKAAAEGKVVAEDKVVVKDKAVVALDYGHISKF